jgi:hypothetical protein
MCDEGVPPSETEKGVTLEFIRARDFYQRDSSL